LIILELLRYKKKSVEVHKEAVNRKSFVSRESLQDLGPITFRW